MRHLARALLGRPPIVHRAAGRPQAVALTFDDGPSAWTARIAHALEAHGCRGTFFVLGEAAARDPAAVAALAAAGHELGNHLYSHADPERQSLRVLRAEIDRTAAVVGEASGARPSLLRPPYCGAPRRVAWAACRKASVVVLRSVDPADWNLDSADEIVDRVLAAVGPGDIVCLHDGMPLDGGGTATRTATAEAVERLVPALLERDLRPVTVSELLR